MVTKRSEYQRQFKVSTLKKNVPSYYENLVFRNQFRNRQYFHTPIDWESSDESESSSLETVNYSSHKKSGSQTKKCTDDITSERSINNKQNKICDDYDERVDKKVNKCTNTENALIDSEESSSVSEDDGENEVVVLVKRKKHKCDGPKQKVPTNKTYICKRTRMKCPDRCQEIPKPCKKVLPVYEKPPFVAYGWAERLHHQTHNVRAPNDIYTHALNAKQNMLLHKREEQEKRECHRKQLNALFKKHIALQRCGSPVDWKSEYKSCFPAYDSYEYVRVLSARAASTMSRK
ncbi:uncharacterized protein LOC121371675 [Gigantopelta aegis]|uniref:uncharacterized protein LOC121371675 n=1 Tax=Gigantopelta aegis TaxID=1735272 RepID=UPI001B88CBD0|nr:uncharacterized protein LOC121371675 [Gigantopelta aegis]XP_041353678.1 uncharacterized protein LOC121371675 [Gigantopelta aegis]